MKRHFGLLITVVLLLTLALPLAAQEEVYFPTTEWRTSTPEEQGMDSAKLLEALDYIERAKFEMDSVTVIRNGHIVLDAQYYPYTVDIKHQLWTGTTSVVSTLVGIAIDQGVIEGIDQPILEMFPDYAPANPDNGQMGVTVGNLLTMSSGFLCPRYGIEIMSDGLSTPDAMHYALEQYLGGRGPTFTPGTRLDWCVLNSNLLLGALQRAVGMPVLRYAEEHLFAPIGIQDYEWLTDQNDVPFGTMLLSLKPHDMARIGYLYLHDGAWAGEQIVSSEWINLVTCADPTRCPFANLAGMRNVDYGYNWWYFRPDFYAAEGDGGQYIAIAPEQNMVVVLTGYGISPAVATGSEAFDLIANRILGAAQSDQPLPPNEEARAALEVRVAQLAEPEPADVLQREIATAISGQVFDLRTALWASPTPPNFPTNVGHDLNLESFALTFDESNKAVLDLTYADASHVSLDLGLDGVWRSNVVEPDILAARGYWNPNSDIFIAEVRWIGGGYSELYTIRYESDYAELRWYVPPLTVGNTVRAVPRQP